MPVKVEQINEYLFSDTKQKQQDSEDVKFVKILAHRLSAWPIEREELLIFEPVEAISWSYKSCQPVCHKCLVNMYVSW